MSIESTPDFDDATAGLAEFIVDVEFEDLPDDVVDLSKRHLLDTLGCMLYGSTTPWVQRIISGLSHADETGAVAVPGRAETFSPARAILVSGTASHSMDFDDTTRPGLHAGSATVSSALAVSQSTNRQISGADFLTAHSLGVEVGIRAGFGMGRGKGDGGFHPHIGSISCLGYSGRAPMPTVP